jgi:dihydrofolate synthase/folylpolyglutamate synthase
MNRTAFERAEAYLTGTINESVSPRTAYKLDRMQHLLRALGDPHLAYPTVHVGGTSGKGSTCTMIAGALQAAGKRVALHTKPHLHAVTERARVGGVPIEPERFAELLDEMMPAIESTAAAGLGRATYYETLLALAFLHFAREDVDVAVIEVGLGGRLDGTNVVVPEVCAITSIGLDHTDVLGESIEEIAREKGGIAKSGVPLVLAGVPEAAAAVVRSCALQAGARIVAVADQARIESGSAGTGGQAFEIVTAAARYRLKTRVAGEFQRINAATAIVTLEQLRPDLAVGPQAVEAAFSALTIPGRMEIVPGYPTVVFDIAHNAEKAAHLVASLRETFGRSRMHYVVAIGESKDARAILAELGTLPGTFVFTSFDVPGRPATSPKTLAALAESLGYWGRSIADPAEALSIARRNAASGDVVVVTGSTFVVAALRDWWSEQVAAAG